MLITLSENEILENPFVTTGGEAAFYRFVVAKAFCRNFDDIKSLDCCRINVSPDIQESWFGYAESNGVPAQELSMFLLNSGPKAKPELEPMTVELEEGCVAFEPTQSPTLDEIADVFATEVMTAVHDAMDAGERVSAGAVEDALARAKEKIQGTRAAGRIITLEKYAPTDAQTLIDICATAKAN